jgi:xylan 1,4-beta-xylosidase
MHIDLRGRIADWRPVWRYFGYDEPNYMYIKDGVRLLSQLAALSPETVYVRTHNLLTSGDGTPALKRASELALFESPRWVNTDAHGALALSVTLPRQAVSLLQVELPR